MLDASSINKVLLSIDLRRLYTNFFILLSIRHGVSGMLAYFAEVHHSSSGARHYSPHEFPTTALKINSERTLWLG